MHIPSHSLSHTLTSRRGAWLSLLIGAGLLGALLGIFSGASTSTTHQTEPPGSESARVAAAADEFADADDRTVIVVASSADGSVLTPSEASGIATLGDELTA